MSLSGKVALVTGASRGIGRAIAKKLGAGGAKVVVNYSSNKQGAGEVVNTIEKAGGRAIAIGADVSNSHEVDNMLKTIFEKWETIDILVNNAGITRDGLFVRMKDEDWDRVMDINLKSVFLCTKGVSQKMMRQRHGKIINVSSVAGLAGNPGQANYSASKAGIIGFSKAIARELAPRNIQVNIVAPGYIHTDMTDSLPSKVKEGILGKIPLARYGEPEDVANLVAFLASEDSAYITGQVINVDGGMIM